MLSEWYSAADLTGLPGLPDTRSGLIRASKRGEWQRRKRAGRGGGYEYHISSLPTETQQHLRRAAATAACNSVTQQEFMAATDPSRGARLKAKETGLKTLAAMPADHPKKQRAKAREWLLRRWADFARVHQVGHAACVHEFVTAYQAGDLMVPDCFAEWLPARHAARSLDRATLFRWQKDYREQGLAGLMDGYGKRKGQSKIATNEELQRVVLGCLFQQPHVTPKKIKAYLEASHPQLDIVSVKSIERFLASWKQDNAQAWTYLVNPDQWKNVYMTAFGSHHERIERLNQVWELDSTPADVMLLDGRHVAIGVIDLYSRRTHYRVSKTSKAEAVCAAFRDCVLAWGVPEAVRTDNGADYVAEQFEAVLRDLEVNHELCLPFASEQKGTIERTMRTMSHGILDLLPGFIGHNVAERKVIEARKSFADRIMKPGDVVEVQLTAAEFQEKLDQWCEHVYARDGHSGLNGRTPFEVAAAWRGPIRTIGDERALDALLAEIAGTRTVTKKGIRYEHYDYIAPELAAYIGQEVRLKHDPDDLGQLYVYKLEGAFITLARAPELQGISRADAAAIARAKQREFLSAQRQEFQQYKRGIKENMAEAILRHRIEQSKNVTAFPPRTEDYTTEGLQQAAQAARAKQGPERRELTAEERRAHEALKAEFENTKVEPLRGSETQRQTFQRWVRLERRAAAGESLRADDVRFLTTFVQQPEWRTELMLHREFELLVDGLPVIVDAEQAKKSPLERAQ